MFYHISDDLKIYSGQSAWPKTKTSFFEYGDGVSFYNRIFENEIISSIKSFNAWHRKKN